MERFDLLFKKHNVEVRRAWLANDASLTRLPDHIVITCCRGLDQAHVVVSTAMMLGILEMGWEGQFFRFRFPRIHDSRTLRRASDRSIRDYRQAWRWAASFLLPDRLLDAAVAEDLEPWAICEAEGLPQELVDWRLARWRAKPKFRSA